MFWKIRRRGHTRPDGDRGIVTLEVESVVDGQVTVGPGTVEVTLPAGGVAG